MRLVVTLPFALAVLAGASAWAQDAPGPLILSFDGLYSSQGSADLTGGGEFEASRTFLRAGGLYRFGETASVGLFLSRGWVDYSFGGAAAAPFGDINDLRVSVPIRFAASHNVDLFVSPSLRFDYEDGASRSDGETYGAFIGAAWELSERLTIGPAFGVFTEIESDDPNIFPALLIDWDITDRLNLSTGPTIGATQGPGLTLNYDVGEDFSVGLAGRIEEFRFRLNQSGPAPGGVGQDSSIPLVVTFDYSPFPGTGVSAFAGAELDGELQLEDQTGRVIDSREYDAAPLFGAAIRLAF